MPTLSYVQMAQYLANAGFPSDQLATGAAIGMAESGGQTEATNHNTNGTTDYGFMQINSGNDAPGTTGSTASFDPATCAQQAYALYKLRGWQPWDGDQLNRAKYIGPAQAAISGANIHANPGAGTGDTFTTEDAGLGDIGSSLNFLEQVAKNLVNPKFWIRAAMVMGGLFLIALAINKLIRQTSVYQNTIGKIPGQHPVQNLKDAAGQLSGGGGKGAAAGEAAEGSEVAEVAEVAAL